MDARKLVFVDVTTAADALATYRGEELVPVVAAPNLRDAFLAHRVFGHAHAGLLRGRDVVIAGRSKFAASFPAALAELLPGDAAPASIVNLA